MLTVPIYMMQMFDRVVPSRNFDTLMWLTLIAVVALGVMAALEGVRGRMMVRLASWFDRELRSEEHTSELQSLMRISYAVFCLKKKNINTNNNSTTNQNKNSVQNQ